MDSRFVSCRGYSRPWGHHRDRPPGRPDRCSDNCYRMELEQI